MSIVVEHEKRRRDILEKALDVFMEEGYENATIQKIADRYGITRTTLYSYFKNKREIFNYSIKELLIKVEGDIAQVRKDKGLNSAERMIRVLSVIIDRLHESRRLLLVILDYLLNLAKSGADPDDRVRRRTLKLRHILATLVIEGIQAGELAPMEVKIADDLLYGILEAAIFRLTVLKHTTVEDLKRSAALAVRRLCASPGPSKADRQGNPR
ncbi:MAG: TetR/AcrR family transcriptional regulator [Treponema sp.]|nr:TetR/AcrR family transcriptional regulator [Treponema sp.]